MGRAAAISGGRSRAHNPAPPASSIRVGIEIGHAAAVEAVAGAAPAFLGRRTWFESAEGKELATLVARRGGAVIAALPTVAARSFVRAVPGSYWPLRGAAVAPDAGTDELAAFLSHPTARRPLGPVWRIGPVLEGQEDAARLSAAARSAGWRVLTRRLGDCYMLDLARLRAEGPWPRSSRLKKNRWQERQLAAEGPLEYRFVRGADWDGETFDMLAAVEAKSWVGTGTDLSGAKFLAPQSRRIWEAAAADPVLREGLSASLLLVGGTPAAFSFRLTDGPFSHCIANGYDPHYGHHSPGRLLLYHDFARAADEGVERIGWGAGDPGYKSEMGAGPGPAILDLLFVRPALLAAVLRPIWER